MMQALFAHAVIGDFRAPDTLRFGFTPRPIDVDDMDRAIEVIDDVPKRRLWDADQFRRKAAVTPARGSRRTTLRGLSA